MVSYEMPHGDGSVPRLFCVGKMYFAAMRFDIGTHARLQEWLGNVGFETEVVVTKPHGLVIKSADPDGSGDRVVRVTSWVATFPHLTVWTDEEFRALTRPAIMCGYPVQLH